MQTYKPEQIDSAIVAIAKDAGRLQDKIHAVAVSIVAHWIGKPDEASRREWGATRLSSLQAASPYHAQAFSKWVAKYLGDVLVWNKEENIWVAHASNKMNKEQAKETLTECKAEPFYKLKPAPAPKPYNDLEAFLKFAEHLEAKNKKAAESTDIEVHPEFVNKVRELVKVAMTLQNA